MADSTAPPDLDVGDAPPPVPPAQGRTVGEFVRHLIADTVGADGRLWSTLGALARAPGHLTEAYVSGRGGEYLRPTQTYFVLSLALFAVVQVADPGGAAGRALLDSERTFLASDSPSARDERVRDLERFRSSLDAERDSLARVAAEADRLLAAAQRGERSADVAAFLVPDPDALPVHRPSGPYGMEERTGLAQAETAGALLEWLPILLVLLVPVYALGVYIVVGQGRTGVVAVVLALHAHAAAFGLFAVVAAVAAGAGWAVALVGLVAAFGALVLWQFNAFCRVYGAGSGKSLAAAVGWGGAYALGALVALALVYAIITAFVQAGHDLA